MDVATISRRHVAAVMLVILGWAAAAHAEDATLPPAAPAGTRTLADTPFRLVLPQGHLFGDWAGTRTLLNAVGLAGAYTLYAVAAVSSLPFVLAFVRETRGKTLEQM